MVVAVHLFAVTTGLGQLVRGRIAPERTTDRESGASFYAVRIEMDEGALSRERQIELRPGMPAEIFIETGSRSMLSYLTKPLRDQLARAFRDN